MTYRVRYVAVKRADVYGAARASQGDKRGKEIDTTSTEVRDSQIDFREERAVTVEAANEQAAIREATKNLPAGCDISAQVSNP